MNTHQSHAFVLTSVENSVGSIILNRPDCLNAFNLEMGQQALAAFHDFEHNDKVRVMVLRGAGRVFSVGGDGKVMGEIVQTTDDPAQYFKEPLTMFHQLVLKIRQIPKPVIAVLHGAVAGFAFNLSLACDFRIAKANTRFLQAFIKLGLSPDGGGTYFLPRIVGYTRACQLTMLPTEIDAKTALDWGLINAFVSSENFEHEISETALSLAKGPRAALARTKSLLYRSEQEALRAHLEAERLAQVANAAEPDFAEGLQAFMEKRKAKFKA